jgi:hypothetical protein
MERPGLALLDRELGGFEREVGVGGQAAAAAEAQSQALAALLEVGGRRVRRQDAPRRLALGRRRRVEEEGGEADRDLVLSLELLGLDEADVAPGSDEV